MRRLHVVGCGVDDILHGNVATVRDIPSLLHDEAVICRSLKVLLNAQILPSHYNQSRHLSAYSSLSLESVFAS